MDAEPYVNRILDDEGLVGDLEGDAAEKLVGWLVASAGRSTWGDGAEEGEP